jgi:hypothetical protein
MIGTAPITPNAAFTLRTLELYRITHRVCPRLSMEAEVRILCQLNRVGA